MQDFSDEILESAVKELTTVRDWFRWITSQFYQAQIVLGHGSSSYWDESVFLVLQALHLPPDIDQRVLNAKLTSPERTKVLEWVQRRIQQHGV